MTQFMALYGYQSLSITLSLRDNSKVQEMEDHIKHCENSTTRILLQQLEIIPLIVI